MNNKETLQSYNNKLIQNNEDLQTVIDMINNLPEAGEGGTPEIKPRYIHLIKDGVEQVGNTGGIQIRVTTGDASQGQMFNGDGYLGLGAKIWSDAEFNIPNKFDLTEYTIAVVEWAYPRTSSPYARQNAVAKLEINPYLSDNRETVMLTSKGATVARRKDAYIITKATGDDSIAFHMSNTFDASSETPVTAYPVQIFNLYLENPNANVQDKMVEINENGTTIVLPDEGYAALNSVEVSVDVESNLQDKDVEINENGVTTVTADEGFDGLNSVDITINVPTNETPVINNAIDIIRNGVENTNLTGGHTYESIGGDGANFKEIQNTGYVTLTAKQWNRCWWKTVDKIDFKPFKTCKIYVDYSADKFSDTDASLYEWGVVLCESKTVLKLDHKPIVDGVGTFTRNVCEIDITDILPILHEEYFVLQVANLTAQTSYTKYGVNVYNVWLEGEVDTENMIVNITENGTTLITPSEGYRALNSVEIVTNVSSSGDTTLGDGLISGTLSEYASDNLTSIRDYAFYYNSNIAAITAPNVKSIGKYAFYKTTYLQTITIPSVTSIREYAFYNSAVKEINVPVLTTLGDKAFYGCSLLTTFNAPLIETLGSNAFQNCSKLQTVHIPNIKSISHYCFSNCSKLASIDLHNCTAINHYAFQSCNALAALILRSSTLCTLGVYVFSSTSPIALGTGYIYVPSELLEDYKTATNWSDYASQFKAIEELPDTDV